MAGSKGIEGPSSPGEISQTGGPEESGSQGSMGDLLHAKVATLGQLKAVLIEYMGEKEGMKFYNRFMESFCMIMLQQIQQSAQQAQKAAQNMRMDVQ